MATVVTNSQATGLLVAGTDSGGGGVSGAVGETAGGILTNPNDSSALASARLAGRPVPRGKRVILFGGSETARGSASKTVTGATGVTFNAATQTISIVCAHKLHTGAYVFLANESATAPNLGGGGIITVDNGFSYGQITVVDSTHFTMPYWSALPAGSPYLALNGTSTQVFKVQRLQCFTAMSKFAELQRWYGHPLQLILNMATGSNNTSHMVERLPALQTMARLGQFDELRGTGGVGNTLLYYLTNSLPVASAVAQVRADIIQFVNALAPLGIVTTLEMPPAQLNTTAITTAGTLQCIDMLRQLAQDPALRLNIEDEFTFSIDPTTGLARTRYQLNGNDNVHPSNEGCVYYAHEHFAQEMMEGNHYPNTTRLTVSALDNVLGDVSSSQLFDPLLSGTTTVAASGLDSKSSGNVPNVVRTITTAGNASRSAVFSYESTAEFYHIYVLLTAAAAADTFNILLANAAGARGVETQLLALPGATIFAGCDFSFVPLTGSWTSVETDFRAQMSYGGGTVVNYLAYLAADSSNDTANPDGPMVQPRMGPALMPTFTIPTDVTAVSLAGINFLVTAAAAGTALLRISRPTARVIQPF